MAERRYCKRCQKETLHDRVVDIDNLGPTGLGERLFVGIITFGFSELDAERYWKCQCCGKRNNAHG